MYSSLILPWSPDPSERETAYRTAGLLRTKGTLFLLPPPDSALRATYNAPPRPKTRMSSGAVALCKHFERGGASSERGIAHPFWTLPKGSNENKTEIAGQMLEQMLAEAVWKNVMLLHPGLAVYEIRNPQGFGMRWTLDIEEKEDNTGIDTDKPEEPASHGARSQDKDKDEFEKDFHITKINFRGFLEPIAGMDYELDAQE